MDFLFVKPVAPKRGIPGFNAKRHDREIRRRRLLILAKVLLTSLCCLSLGWVLSDLYLEAELAPVSLKGKLKVSSSIQRTQVHQLIETACGGGVPRYVISTAVYEASKKYLLEPELITAVILRESACDTFASSTKGAGGLMQIMPETAKDLGLKNRFSPRENILAGSKYLSYLLKEFNGDLALALAAYNAGPQSVKKHGGVPPYRETKRYVKGVLNTYKKLSSA